MVKNSTTAGNNWYVWDTTRSAYNYVGDALAASSGNAESTFSPTKIDILSNGFKLREAGASGVNDSGVTYIYAAFAETPFKYANAR